VSAALLSVSGASKFFVGGATVYTTKSRRIWAGWTDENLVNYKFVDCGGSLLLSAANILSCQGDPHHNSSQSSQ
jgi:hypothetical protein